MEIVEKDFTITHNGDCWVFHQLKSKKELKQDSKESYKTAGYYTNIFHAIAAAAKWREDKKYPFKESAVELKKLLKEYRKVENTLKIVSLAIYNPISEFKKRVFDEDKQLQYRHLQ